MNIVLTESEKKCIRKLHEQTLVSSYIDKECYKEYPNANIDGIKKYLTEMPNTIRQLNIDSIKYSTIDLVILSKLICVMNQTLYSVNEKKWQKEIDKKLYIDVSDLISEKCSGILYFKEGVDKFRDRYNNFKKLIDEVYK
jgi:N12 class adenine-specific DNA methylase